jgi:hypothetical protein
MRFAERIAVAVAAGTLLIGLASSVGTAYAGYVVTLRQVGGFFGGAVDASGSGKIDLAGLTFEDTGNFAVGMQPSKGLLVTGLPMSSPIVGPFVELGFYQGFKGPSNFGSGKVTSGSSGTGDAVGIDAAPGPHDDFLGVPLNYISDTSLTSTLTFAGQDFQSLGVTPGTYKWTWGPGPDQNFTIAIGAVGATVPESSTWAMMLLGFAGLGFAGYRQARKGRSAPAV